MSEKIFSIWDDDALLEEIEKYKKDIKESKVNLLLEGNYGIQKSGDEFGEARSLISKYLYFVSEHKFPIEDSLLKSNINNVLKYFGYSNIRVRKDSNFLHEIISFCESEKIEFDKFDNFMWLLGKLSKGSLSALLSKDNYLKVIKNLGIESTKSEEIDEEIAKKIIDTKYLNSISKYISKDLYDFLIFIKDFKRNN